MELNLLPEDTPLLPDLVTSSGEDDKSVLVPGEEEKLVPGEEEKPVPNEDDKTVQGEVEVGATDEVKVVANLTSSCTDSEFSAR